MTLDHAAQAAADREFYGHDVGEVKRRLDDLDLRDLYVRAFRQGYEFKENELTVTTPEAQYLDGFVTGFEELQARGFFLHHEDGRVMDREDFISAMCVGMKAILNKTTIWRAGTADKDTTPATGSTAASIEAVRPFQSCHCPAAHGEPCPLTLDECAARTDDYVGLPWFGARLRRIWDGFVTESLNGVVCSIPDTGLNTPAHRTWCVRCQRRYMELKALVEMLDHPAAGSPAATDQG